MERSAGRRCGGDDQVHGDGESESAGDDDEHGALARSVELFVGLARGGVHSRCAADAAGEYPEEHAVDDADAERHDRLYDRREQRR